MKIGNHTVGKDGVYIIAELSANHNQSLDVARQSVLAASECGANAIKLQTYTPDTITLDIDTPDFQTNPDGPWAGQTLYNLYQEAYTPWEWHEELRDIAHRSGLDFLSSPFDLTAVDLLEKLNVPAYKIASFEITDIPLIKYTASKMKPMIISTGIATMDDIQMAIDACYSAGNNEIILLKCTSSYPAPLNKANLKMIDDFRDRFGVLAGLSDHTLGNTAAIVASSLGAVVIEKHFILEHSLGGPDSAFSLDKDEFGQMVKLVREAESCLGKVNYELDKTTLKNREHSRSLYVAEDIKKGEHLTLTNIKSVRPGYGLHPRYFSEIIGKVAARDASKGERVEWGLIR